MNNRFTTDGLQPNRLRHYKRKPRSTYWKIDNIIHRQHIREDKTGKERDKRLLNWIAGEEKKTDDSEHNTYINQMFT